MERAAVGSTSLASVGYDRSSATLEVEFHHGGVYRYFEVPYLVYRRLLAAESMGRCFGELVRDAYRFERVD